MKCGSVDRKLYELLFLCASITIGQRACHTFFTLTRADGQLRGVDDPKRYKEADLQRSPGVHRGRTAGTAASVASFRGGALEDPLYLKVWGWKVQCPLYLNPTLQKHLFLSKRLPVMSLSKIHP